jgi:serine/threonine protein kinase
MADERDSENGRVTPENWARIKDLFGRALELEAVERREFLRRECGQDDSTLAEVESLLSSYEPDNSRAAEPTETQSDEAEQRPGSQIDRYQIVRQIGAGGMGAVYLGLRADDAYEKRVAIKLVNARIDVHQVLGRFRHERQILATLDHPNIARLLDGGTTGARLPYFVMDYVEGTRIDEYCDGRKLLIPERINLFLDVCSAVQYVHQNLVVHRDLKPSNILVTAEGVPKLLDFGIAKLLKPEMFSGAIDATRAEFRMMTPRYASPEQVRGDPVTVASDVYSLGVVLYELLTGHRPYDLKTESPVDVVRAVCEHEPEKPSVVVVRPVQSHGDDAVVRSGSVEQIARARSTVANRLKRQLRGDLDTIVLKSLRKEPQRRYGSVDQFAEDLRRYLQGLPVRAHADSWAYRTRKFVRRHRSAVAASVLIVLSLIGGVVATTWQAGIARGQRARAERQFNDIRRLSTSFLFEFHSAIQNLPGSTPARKLLVQRALEYLGKLAEEAHGDRRLQLDLAEAFLKVGDVQGNPYAPNLGDTEGAVASYRQALEASQLLVARDAGDMEAQRYVARSYRALADVLPQLGRPTEAVSNFRRAIAIFDLIRATQPSDSHLREELAACYQELGDLLGHNGLQNLGDPAGALQSYDKSLALYEELAARDPASRVARRGVALLQIRIGDMQEIRDDLNSALQAYGAALQTAEQLSAEDPANAEDLRRLALAHRKVGGIEEDLRDYKEALKEYAEAASINESLMNVDPTNVQANMGYVISLRWTGDLLKLTGEAGGALVKYRRVLEILDRLSVTHPANVTVQERLSEMLIVTARLLAERGEIDESRAMTRRGLDMSRELANRPEATPDDLSQYALGFLTCEPPALREPATALRYAKASVEKSGGTDSGNLDILAQAYFANHDLARAIESEERALALLAPVGPNQPVPPTRSRLEAQLARFKATER